MRVLQLLSPVLAVTLSGCGVQIDHTSVGSESYFKAASATEIVNKCSQKTESNWYIVNFSYQNLDHKFISPLGVICARNSEGKLVSGYVDESHVTATHKIRLGRRWFVFPFSQFVKIRR
jgi:hypothetical protein